MKKQIAILLMGILLCVGCGKKEDVITNLSYVSTAYDMSYDYFDSEKTYQFDVEAGQSILLDVICDSGSIDVKIVDLQDNPIYHQKIVVSLKEDIKIETAGRYIVIMTGNKTAGEIKMSLSE